MHVIESGNVAAATGVKLARARVIAAYPITPQTPLTENCPNSLIQTKWMQNIFLWKII